MRQNNRTRAGAGASVAKPSGRVTTRGREKRLCDEFRDLEVVVGKSGGSNSSRYQGFSALVVPANGGAVGPGGGQRVGSAKRKGLSESIDPKTLVQQVVAEKMQQVKLQQKLEKQQQRQLLQQQQQKLRQQQQQQQQQRKHQAQLSTPGGRGGAVVGGVGGTKNRPMSMVRPTQYLTDSDATSDDGENNGDDEPEEAVEDVEDVDEEEAEEEEEVEEVKPSSRKGGAVRETACDTTSSLPGEEEEEDEQQEDEEEEEDALEIDAEEEDAADARASWAVEDEDGEEAGEAGEEEEVEEEGEEEEEGEDHEQEEDNEEQDMEGEFGLVEGVGEDENVYYVPDEEQEDDDEELEEEVAERDDEVMPEVIDVEEHEERQLMMQHQQQQLMTSNRQNQWNGAAGGSGAVRNNNNTINGKNGSERDVIYTGNRVEVVDRDQEMIRLTTINTKVQLCEEDKVSLEDFELLKVLGTGAYGTVFLVRKLTGIDRNRIYAMKVLRKCVVILKEKTAEHTRTERQV